MSPCETVGTVSFHSGHQISKAFFEEVSEMLGLRRLNLMKPFQIKKREDYRSSITRILVKDAPNRDRRTPYAKCEVAHILPPSFNLESNRRDARAVSYSPKATVPGLIIPTGQVI